jgi:hypothetical protein
LDHHHDIRPSAAHNRKRPIFDFRLRSKNIVFDIKVAKEAMYPFSYIDKNSRLFRRSFFVCQKLRILSVGVLVENEKIVNVYLTVFLQCEARGSQVPLVEKIVNIYLTVFSQSEVHIS